MSNTREKMIELLREVQYLGGLEEKIADRLIANGVTILVRCGECKYRYTAKSGLILCTQHITMTPKANDFCSYGERRTDG